MKEKRNKKNLPDGIDLDSLDPKICDYQELILEEVEEDNFYSFLGEDHNNLGEIIKSWESLKFSI